MTMSYSRSCDVRRDTVTATQNGVVLVTESQSMVSFQSSSTKNFEDSMDALTAQAALDEYNRLGRDGLVSAEEYDRLRRERGLENSDYERVKKVIKKLANNPRPRGPHSLQAKPRRLRKGSAQ